MWVCAVARKHSTGTRTTSTETTTTIYSLSLRSRRVSDFFQNFGKTRRQGVDGSLSYSGQKLNAGAEYTFLSATYQSSQVIGSGSNSTNSNALDGGVGVPDGGNIKLNPAIKFRRCRNTC